MVLERKQLRAHFKPPSAVESSGDRIGCASLTVADLTTSHPSHGITHLVSVAAFAPRSRLLRRKSKYLVAYLSDPCIRNDAPLFLLLANHSLPVTTYLLELKLTMKPSSRFARTFRSRIMQPCDDDI